MNLGRGRRGSPKLRRQQGGRAAAGGSLSARCRSEIGEHDLGEAAELAVRIFFEIGAHHRRVAAVAHRLPEGELDVRDPRLPDRPQARPGELGERAVRIALQVDPVLAVVVARLNGLPEGDLRRVARRRLLLDRGRLAFRSGRSSPGSFGSAFLSKTTRKTRTGRAMFFTLCSPRSSKRHGDAVAQLVARRARDADSAGLGQRLEPGGDIDAVAENVAVLARARRRH